MLSKLNWMVQSVPAGAIVLQAWLSEQGVSPQLAQKYTKNGWLQKLNAGVYVRPGKSPQWYNALASLQEQLQLPVHLAGLTSLAYQGKSHYLQLQEKWIWLGTPPKTYLPKWFKAFPSHQTTMASDAKAAVAVKQNPHPQWLLMTSNILELESSDLVEIEIDGAKVDPQVQTKNLII